MQLEIGVVLIVFGIWLLALTIFFLSYFRFFNKLVKGAKGEELKNVLERVLATQARNTQGLIALEKEVRVLEEDGKLHVQKTGLVRFNPFGEVGGEHSLSLALLDGTNSGLVITILHARERSRVYAKSIKNGKSELDLSEEEKKALLKAQKS